MTRIDETAWADIVVLARTIAAKAGVDFCHALWKRARRRKEPADRASVQLPDPYISTQLIYIPPLTAEAIVRLAALNTRKSSNRVLVWDSSHDKWRDVRRRRTDARIRK